MTRITKPWWLKPETIKRLHAFGQYGETQDQLINRLLDELQEATKDASYKKMVEEIDVK